jgi:hypothetical protein
MRRNGATDTLGMLRRVKLEQLNKHRRAAFFLVTFHCADYQVFNSSLSGRFCPEKTGQLFV